MRRARLVLEAFVGPPAEGQTADHINRVKTDDRIENLRWATRVEQQANRAAPVHTGITSKSRGVWAINLQTGEQEYFDAVMKANKVFPRAAKCLSNCKFSKQSQTSPRVGAPPEERWAFTYAEPQLYAHDDENGEEEWRGMPDKSDYEVSSLGRVRCLSDHLLVHDPAEPARRLHKNEVNYYCLSIGGVGFRMLHRLVATAFHGPPPSPTHHCHHIDGTRDNNEAANLQWLTPAEHSAAHTKMEH